jgi:phage virion morphogenesis protein
MTIKIEATIDGLEGLGAALERMKALGQNPRPIWKAIGNKGESSTRLRFKNQVGPDGVSWKPSLRVQKNGGQTLIKSTILLRSITHRADRSGAEWGSNIKYAAIHQFGGEIKRKEKSGVLRLRTDAGGRLLRQKDYSNLSVFAKHTHKRVTERSYSMGAHTIHMPARPFLGVNAEDGREMLALAIQEIDDAAQAGKRGGAYAG